MSKLNRKRRDDNLGYIDESGSSAAAWDSCFSGSSGALYGAYLQGVFNPKFITVYYTYLSCFLVSFMKHGRLSNLFTATSSVAKIVSYTWMTRSVC
jgi:hypothetical protein